jgi:hypothetical protein
VNLEQFIPDFSNVVNRLPSIPKPAFLDEARRRLSEPFTYLFGYELSQAYIDESEIKPHPKSSSRKRHHEDDIGNTRKKRKRVVDICDDQQSEEESDSSLLSSFPPILNQASEVLTSLSKKFEVIYRKPAFSFENVKGSYCSCRYYITKGAPGAEFEGSFDHCFTLD